MPSPNVRSVLKSPSFVPGVETEDAEDTHELLLLLLLLLSIEAKGEEE